MPDAETRPTAWPGVPEFQKTFRGWDPEDVRLHLEVVKRQFRDLESRIQTLEAQLEQATRERDSAKAISQDPYAGVSAHIADALRDLDEHVRSMRAAADAEADQIRADALRLRSSTLEELRTLREHMAESLSQLDAALHDDDAPAPRDLVVLPEQTGTM